MELVKKRGRRLKSHQNIRALLASQIRSVEGDPSIATSTKARLIAALARVLDDVLYHCATERALKNVERQLAEAEAASAREAPQTRAGVARVAVPARDGGGDDREPHGPS